MNGHYLRTKKYTGEWHAAEGIHRRPEAEMGLAKRHSFDEVVPGPGTE